MLIHLLIAPPASGKTQTCLERVRTIHKARPFAQTWILVPDQLQADAVRARLARMGGALPTRVATFEDLNGEVLEQAGRSLPVAGGAMLHHLLQQVIRSLAEGGQIPYYQPISATPGFGLACRDRIAELKGALVMPEHLSELARQRGVEPDLPESEPGLADLAAIYAAYQARLQDLDWADLEGLGWLAYAALQEQPALLAGLALLVVDGFDTFTGAQLRTLELLARRAAETWITLPGAAGPPRPAHRRFAATAARLQAWKGVTLVAPPALPRLPPTLAALEASLFEPGAPRVSPGPDLERIEARSPAEESREALRWLKACIVRQGIPLAACALAVPALDSYRDALQSAAAEFGLPLRFSQGPRLAATPAAAALLDLLRLAGADYPLRSLLDTVRSPYFDLSSAGLRRADARTLEMASRVGPVVQGLAQWEQVLGDLAARAPTVGQLPDAEAEDADQQAPRLPEGALAARLLAGLGALARRLSPPEGDLPLLDWAAWLQDVLDDLGFFTCALRLGETAAAAACERVLRDLARSEALTGPNPVAYPALLQELGGLLNATCIAEEDPQKADRPAIRVVRTLEGRGVRFQALAVLGLAESSFPVVERQDPFLSEAVRQELGMELRLGQDQAGLFYQAITRPAQRLLLTRPYLAKDGETWEASPYWNAVQSVLTGLPTRIRPEDERPLAEAASPEELLFWAARRQAQTGADLAGTIPPGLVGHWKHIGETRPILAARLQKQPAGPYEGGLQALAAALGRRYGPRSGWSASRLESYLGCPYSFLAASALGLEVLELPQAGYQVNQLGSLLHAVLEELYRQASDPNDTPALLAQLPGVAGRIFAAAPQQFNFRPSPLWEQQQAELLAVLEDAVSGISNLDPDGNWRPLAQERVFGMEGQPPLHLPAEGGEILLHGVIDRVDINPAGQLRIIDYKSGSSHQSPNDLLNGSRLQLPIYALAASQALGLGEAVEGFYWALFAAKASALKLSTFAGPAGSGPQAAYAVAAGFINAAVKGIRDGDFQPQPPAGGCPSYCAAAAWCWRYKPGRTP